MGSLFVAIALLSFKQRNFSFALSSKQSGTKLLWLFLISSTFTFFDNFCFYIWRLLLIDVKISSDALTIVSLNVRGVSNFKKRRTIFTWCREKNADVIFFLQETHSNKATENQWQREWGGRMLFSHGSPNSCGTAILINNKVNCTVLCTVPDPLGRFVISKVQVDEKVYVLVNIYAPNKNKDSILFIKKLHTLLQTENLESEENIIVGGDFICPLNPTLDKRGGTLIMEFRRWETCVSILTTLILMN